MSYILLIFEYFVIKRTKLLFSLIISICISLIVCFLSNNLSMDVIVSLVGNSINVLGILLGFTASIFAILVSSGNSKVEDSKSFNTNRKLFNKNVSIFDELIVELAFLIGLLGVLLVIGFLFPIFYNILSCNIIIIFSVYVGLVVFSIMQLISSILGFYFIITKKK